MFESITSVQNPRIKHLVRLREGSHRKRQGLFLVEGGREVSRALTAEWPLETLYFCPERFRGPASNDTVERADTTGVECVQLSESAFAKAAFRENPDGLLAVARCRPRPLDDLKLSKCPLILVVEGIEKPGNLGALIRTVDAAGADGLILCEPVADIHNPNAIRASQGSFFHVPMAIATSAETLHWLRTYSITAVATSPGATKAIWDIPFTVPTALVVGAESTGLSQTWLDGAATTGLVPMCGEADSLNLNTSAAICLFEALRQRRIAN